MSSGVISLKENINDMETTQRISIWDDLKKYGPTAAEKDYIEITEWINGDGYDIAICENSCLKHISLSYVEIEAIDFLIKQLEYNRSFNKIK